MTRRAIISNESRKQREANKAERLRLKATKKNEADHRETAHSQASSGIPCYIDTPAPGSSGCWLSGFRKYRARPEANEAIPADGPSRLCRGSAPGAGKQRTAATGPSKTFKLADFAAMREELHRKRATKARKR